MAENATENVTALRPLTDDEVLAWLQAQPNGRTTMSQTALAARWGWSRHAVRRRLGVWGKRGIVKRKGDVLVAAPANAQPTPKPERARAWTRASKRAAPHPGEGAPLALVLPSTTRSAAAEMPTLRPALSLCSLSRC
jgi:hypothetical protein